MKTITAILVLIIFSCPANAQKADSIAQKVIRLNLEVVSNFIDKKDTSLQKISEAISFMNEITGINNEFHGKYYGQFKPTASDLKTWTAWIETNKDYLVWDKESRSIMLYKRVKAYIY